MTTSVAGVLYDLLKSRHSDVKIGIYDNIAGIYLLVSKLAYIIATSTTRQSDKKKNITLTGL